MKEIYSSIFDKAKAFLDTRENELHTRIAYAFAVQLLVAEGGDEAVVLPAIILHDVGWKCIAPELHTKAFGPGTRDAALNRVHEVEGARIARTILEEFGYHPESIEEIVLIIEGHDSRKEPLSLNDAIVKDADKLWRFSREGLSVDPKRFNVDPAVHAQWLGLQIDKWFLTETGKILARNEQRDRALSLALTK